MTSTSLDDVLQQIKAYKRPPVHLWQPKDVGEIDIVIDQNGAWFHESQQIERFNLVKLFASILWAEAGQFYLKTPVEKLRIQVVDVPFMVTKAELLDAHYLITNNVDDQVVIGQSNPVQLRCFNGLMLPYVLIRQDLWARASRSVYMQWVEQGLDASDNLDQVWLTSGEYRFEVARAK